MITVNDVSYEFEQEMTLAKALSDARIDLEAPMLITVDGRLVDRSGINHFVLSDGDRIQVMSILSGG